MGFTNEMDDGGALNQILSRRYGVQGAPAPAVASELFPVIRMDGAGGRFGYPIEWGYLGGWRKYSAYISRAEVVGEFATVGLTNAAESGVLAVVESLRLASSSSSTDYLIGVGAPGGTIAAGYNVDSRFSAVAAGGALSTAHPTARSDAAVPYLNLYARMAGGTSELLFEEEYVVAPGSALYVTSTPANRTTELTIRWRERVATDSELRSALSA